MRRRAGWFPVYAAAVKAHRKFVGLSHADLGAWTDLRAEVETLEDAPLPDRAYALSVLTRRSGRRQSLAMLDLLISRRLLDVQDDGSIAIHDIAENRGRYPSDEPAESRLRKERSRRDNDTCHDDVTTVSRVNHDDVTLTRARPQETRPDETRLDKTGTTRAPDVTTDDEPEGPAITWLAKHGSYLRPDGNGLHRQLCQLVEKRGLPMVIATFEALAKLPDAPVDPRGYVFGAANSLNRPPTTKPMSREERERSEAKAALAAAAERAGVAL